MVPLSFPFIQLPDKQSKFIERTMRSEPRKELKAVAAAAGANNGAPEHTGEPQEVKQIREKQLRRTEQQQQRFFE